PLYLGSCGVGVGLWWYVCVGMLATGGKRRDCCKGISLYSYSPMVLPFLSVLRFLNTIITLQGKPDQEFVCVCERVCLRECVYVCVCVCERGRERRGEREREMEGEGERDGGREREERGTRPWRNEVCN